MTKRIISSLMALLMVLGAFVITVGAEEAAQPEYTYNTSNEKATIDYLDGSKFQTDKEIEDLPGSETCQRPFS